MKAPHAIIGLVAALALAACATPPGPVEVTRFVAPERLGEIGRGTFFVEAMPGDEASNLELAPYKAAVASELVKLGFVETDRETATLVAQIGVKRGVIAAGERRGPVSVGVGGSTGSYGSGLGLGIGINLGGGPKDRLGTELAVRLSEKDGATSVWEGRADFRPPEDSPLAQGKANAQTVASALFRDFPGNNGETIAVKVSE